MGMGEWLAAVSVVLLAIYGCASLVRRICLWATRCRAVARCYRIAIPREGAAIEPLMQCLSTQAAWSDPAEPLLLVVRQPPQTVAASERMPVTAVTPQELVQLLTAE